MGIKRINEFPEGSGSLSSDDVFLFMDDPSGSGITKKISLSQISIAAPVQSVAGRTGIVTLTKSDVGLDNVDNTSDANKPVSTAQQTALNGKAASSHSHAISDVTSLQTALDNKQASGNYATLTDGKVPSSQLPSYVDDVIEVTNLAGLPVSGEVSKIYVTLDTNKTYRWSGSVYIEISASPGSTDSVTEGSINKYYTDARASAAAPVQSVAGRTGIVTLTKSDVGLGNVDNTSDANKPVSTAQQTALDLKAGKDIFIGTKGIDVNDLLSGQKEITTNFIAGNGIAFNYNNDESLTIATITNNGTIDITNNSTTNITIPSGYVVGSLSLYQNGVKLLEEIDYTATNGTTVTLTTPATSGSYIEYITPTISNNIQSLIDTVYDTIIYDLGAVSGAVNIDYNKNKLIQKLTINGSSVSLNKGSGWPILSNISRDVVLQINCTTPATITWNIVGSNWYNTPTALLAGEEHMILLRCMSNNIIQGHYIGTKTNTSTALSAWVQQGSDIDGEAAGDYSGVSVRLSSDGSVLAIGASLNDGGGTDSGHVRVYSWNGSSWIQRGGDIDGEAADDGSGFSISLSSDGSVLAIGEYLNDSNGNNSGRVRVYSWNGSSWIQRGGDIDGEAAGDNSGHRISLNSAGDILAIGAYGNDGGGINSGHVRVYSWNGSSWIQQGSDINGEAANDFSGLGVSLNSTGNILAIGAPVNSGYRGHVRVYSWNGSSWIQRGGDIDGEAAGDNSGSSVSLNSAGDILAIGAYGNDGGGINSGHVRVYSWNGSSWIQRGGDIDGEAANDGSAFSVSLNSTGDILAIGAFTNDGGGADSGHVRVYSWNGSSWIQRGGDIDGEAANDYSGRDVSLSSDGNVLAIGAYLNDGNGENSGHVRVYRNSLIT